MQRHHVWGMGLLPLLAAGCLESSLEIKLQGFDLNCVIPPEDVYPGPVLSVPIPALTNPLLLTAGEALGYADTDRVLGVEVGGTARAYPLRILWWHEIVNDTLGGQPVLVSYSPLSGSGVAFDPRVGDQPRQFGVSGLYFENNLMMFDAQTQSLWSQLSLGAQCGPARGTELRRVPVIETTWGDWRDRHPETTVLSTGTGHIRDYGSNPYGEYSEPDNGSTVFPSSPWSPARPPKEPVLGVREGTSSVAYPFGVLDTAGVSVAVNDTLAGRPILVAFHHESGTARAYDRRVEDQTLDFTLADPDALTLTDQQTGSTWNALGRATAGPLAGKQLAPLTDAWVLFWFSWSVFQPNTRIYQ